MNTNDLNTALYEKMAAEQDKYRDWLKSQPPEEILNHTYEYTIREDIVMAMEELELTDAQAKALLESPSPLADVYRYFEKLETGYMDVIRDSIESRADDVCRAKEELRTTPVYPHSAAYASEHGEMAQYNLSYQANSACKEAIEQIEVLNREIPDPQCVEFRDQLLLNTLELRFAAVFDAFRCHAVPAERVAVCFPAAAACFKPTALFTAVQSAD